MYSAYVYCILFVHICMMHIVIFQTYLLIHLHAWHACMDVQYIQYSVHMYICTYIHIYIHNYIQYVLRTSYVTLQSCKNEAFFS